VRFCKTCKTELQVGVNCTANDLKFRRRQCRSCIAARQREHYHADIERSRFKNRTKGWRYRGIQITPEEYAEKFERQGGLCMICGMTSKGKSSNAEALTVDHNHTTGKVRDLLCRRCNSSIGVIENALYPAWLAYLEKWKNVQPN
jgi:hypothetical protein